MRFSGSIFFLGLIFFQASILLANSKPSITTNSCSTKENTKFICKINAEDADEDNLTFSLGDATTFKINSRNGKLFFRALPDFETRKVYRTKVFVTDGKKRISKRITIRVKNVNEPPTFRKVYFKTKQNAKDRFDMGISDPEGKTLSYRLSGADKSYFWISKSGILRYRGGDPGVLASRTFRLKVTATDGAKSKTRLIRVKHRVPNAVKACIFGIGTFNNCTFGI